MSTAAEQYTNRRHSEVLMKGLYQLWQQGYLCDTQIYIGGQHGAKVHSLVLEACSSEMFWSDNHLIQLEDDADTNSVHYKLNLPQNICPKVLQVFLTYLYTGKLTVSKETCATLQILSNIFDQPLVLQYCKLFELQNEAVLSKERHLVHDGNRKSVGAESFHKKSRKTEMQEDRAIDVSVKVYDKRTEPSESQTDVQDSNCQSSENEDAECSYDDNPSIVHIKEEVLEESNSDFDDSDDTRQQTVSNFSKIVSGDDSLRPNSMFRADTGSLYPVSLYKSSSAVPILPPFQNFVGSDCLNPQSALRKREGKKSKRPLDIGDGSRKRKQSKDSILHVHGSKPGTSGETANDKKEEIDSTSEDKQILETGGGDSCIKSVPKAYSLEEDISSFLESSSSDKSTQNAPEQDWNLDTSSPIMFTKMPSNDLAPSMVGDRTSHVPSIESLVKDYIVMGMAYYNKGATTGSSTDLKDGEAGRMASSSGNSAENSNPVKPNIDKISFHKGPDRLESTKSKKVVRKHRIMPPSLQGTSERTDVGRKSNSANSQNASGNITPYASSKLNESDIFHLSLDGRRTRNLLTHSQKREIAHYSSENSNKSHQTIADHFSALWKTTVKRRTVADILKNKEVWEDETLSPFRKKMRTPKYADLERELVKWYSHLCKLNINVTDEALRRKAKTIGEEMNITGFSYSNGWIQRFKFRHNIKKLSNPIVSMEK
ncbi:hypothetical protein CHS0354_038900 [Potamilus streckersoni]|uniref:Uncharacterized protein n=1 Tax=Potamilus streckersoni TaxID=2493646 RepID=A0AAE0SRF1_9BIVA|nr:hypothetical protein CHS0354_038900 [Potamilus streckersoni]